MGNETRLRAKHGDLAAMKSTARLRSRVLALLHAAQQRTGATQVDIAARLGIRKSAVNQVLNGAGNIQIDTLGQYLAAMGLEADLVVAELGEFRLARRERRAPNTLALTAADRDRHNDQVKVLVVNGPRQSNRKPVPAELKARNARVQTPKRVASGAADEVYSWR